MEVNPELPLALGWFARALCVHPSLQRTHMLTHTHACSCSKWDSAPKVLTGTSLSASCLSQMSAEPRVLRSYLLFYLPQPRLGQP